MTTSTNRQKLNATGLKSKEINYLSSNIRLGVWKREIVLVFLNIEGDFDSISIGIVWEIPHNRGLIRNWNSFLYNYQYWNLAEKTMWFLWKVLMFCKEHCKSLFIISPFMLGITCIYKKKLNWSSFFYAEPSSTET